MKVGFARRCITPGYSMPMAGFDRRKDPSTGTLDDLFVRILVLDDGNEPFAFCVFDVLGVDRVLCEKVSRVVAPELGARPERVWVSSTHSHAAPSGIFDKGRTYDESYVNLLIEKVTDTAKAAKADLQPAKIGAEIAFVKGVCSRRNLGRAAGGDYPMPLVTLHFAREKDTLTFTRIACHPTVLDEKNTLYSRDLPGAAIRLLDREETMVITNGACADLSTRFTRNASTPEELERLGGVLADGIRSGEASYEQISCEKIGSFCEDIYLSRSGSLDGELRQFLLDTWHRMMDECDDPQAKREFDSRIAVLERGAVEAEPARKIHVGAVDLGELMLVSLPFEVDSPDGENLEETLTAAAGKPVYLMCYTGGYDGYLPSGAPLSPQSSYEDIASRYLPQSREQVWESAKKCVLNGMK